MRETIGSNIAYPPQRGSFTVPALATSGTVTHSLGVAPDIVIPSPTNSYAHAAGIIFTRKGASDFDYEVMNPQAADATFDYEVGRT